MSSLKFTPTCLHLFSFFLTCCSIRTAAPTPSPSLSAAMNLSGPLLLLLLTAACVVSGVNLYASVASFGNMIECVQPDVSALQYNGYGCYCGFGGRGTPVDELDQCCKDHDECYAAQKRNSQCRGTFNQPYVISYDYNCGRGWASCSASNNYCKAAACECDREAALCFARTDYNLQNKGVNKRFC
uniref:Phospholipase A2 n=1 Tax=Sparus aurata TaxID=8175 RepID=A0A671X8K3_SPAAU